MKSSIKAIYAASLIAVLIGVAMFIGHSEGALVPILIGAGLIVLATYKHLTDYPGK